MKGFTIIELIISMAVFAIVAVVAFPSYYAFQTNADFNAGFYTVVDTARRAQELSRAVDGGSGWGIVILSNHEVVLFRGSSYALRSSSSTQIFTIPLDVTSSGMSEMDFSDFFGYPIATGTITISVPGGTSRVMTINTKGTISF
jgi:prepilin-type N-terminal cleavage/methylation domain-containing protein